MDRRICDAVASRSVVEFSYGGGTRMVEPHCHGMSTTGKEVLRGYQTGGYSSSGNAEGWRLFVVSDIRNFQVLVETFERNRPNYNPNDSAMTTVHCCV